MLSKKIIFLMPLIVAILYLAKQFEGKNFQENEFLKISTKEIPSTNNEDFKVDKSISYQSPFEVKKQVLLPNEKNKEAEFRKKMKELGISPPDKYFDMSFTELKESAKDDIYAALLISERYRDSFRSPDPNVSYDLSINQIEESNKYLEKAALGGILRASTLLSLRFTEQGDAVKAEAWRIVASRLGDDADIAKNKMTVTLSAEQINNSKKAAEEIYNEMLKQKEISR